MSDKSEYYDESGRVLCKVCGEYKQMLSYFHLKSHGMTSEQYKETYPGAPTVGKNFGNIIKYSKSEIFKKKETKIKEDVVTDYEDIEKSPVIDQSKLPVIEEIEVKKSEKLDMNKMIKKVLDKKVFPDPSKSICMEKLDILTYLYNIFSDVQNNYVVEIWGKNQILYEVVRTDIAIPSIKLNIEFPKSGWYNNHRPQGVRDPILRQHGWTIINIEKNHPIPSDVEDKLRELKLI